MALTQPRIFVDKCRMSGEVTGIIIKIVLTVSGGVVCGDIAGEIVITGLPRIHYNHTNYQGNSKYYHFSSGDQRLARCVI